MKKLVALAGAGAMLLSVASPAFAKDEDHQQSSSAFNFATVNETVVTSAATGGVNQSVGGGSVEWSKNFSLTGDATALVRVGTVTNTNLTLGCGACKVGSVYNTAFLNKTVSTGASTGSVNQSVVGGGLFNKVEGVRNVSLTGVAGAQAESWTITNTNFSWSH